MGKQKKQVDFQKVKLKVGRKLPKGANVTDTSFKSRKILIPSQLRKRASTTIPQDKFTLEELLKRADHCNATHRYDALKQIKEKIMQNNDLMIGNLSEILGKVLKVINDTELEVRNATLLVLHFILERTSEDQLESFYSLMITHLCCALTHNSIAIRSDALKLLDYVLDLHPNAVCHSIMVLNNFLDQLSSRSVRGGSNKEHSSKRLLRVEPDENIESHIWRLQVMQRLLKFLTAVVKSFAKKISVSKEEIQEVKWENKPLYIQIYLHGGLKPVNPFAKTYDSKSENDCCQDIKAMKKFIEDLMPLLFDTWKEETAKTTSSKNISTRDSLLSTQEAITLSTVTQIICCIGEWIKLVNKNEPNETIVEWFQENYSKRFHSMFMKSFPFYEQQARKKKGAQILPEKTSVKLNLAICTLYSAFVLGTEHVTECDLNSVITYTLKVIPMESTDGTNIPGLLKITRHFIAYDSSNVGVHSQLLSLQKLCQTLHPLHRNRNLIMSFFSEISLDCENRHLIEFEALSEWFGTLIQEMKNMLEVKLIDKKFLNVIQKIAARRYPAFLEAMQNQAGDLLVLLTSTDEVMQNAAADLIANKMSYLTPEFLKELADLISKNSVSLRNVKYILQHVCSRILSEKEPVVSTEEYVMFLFNVIAGVKVLQMDTWKMYDDTKFSESWESTLQLLAYKIVPSKIWDRHSKIVEYAIESLLWLPDHDNISLCAFYFMRQFLGVWQIMPIHSALGLLSLHHKVACYQGIQPQDKEYSIYVGDLTLSVLVYGIIISNIEEDEDVKEKCGVTSELLSVIPNKDVALNVLNIINLKIPYFEYVSLEFAYYIGAIFLIFIENDFIQKMDLSHLAPILKTLKINCSDELAKQLWYRRVYHYFASATA